MNFGQAIYDFLRGAYPLTAQSFDFTTVTPMLFCPQVVQLPMAVKTQAENIVRAFFQLRESPDWQQRLTGLPPHFANPGNSSILMSYDFHLQEDGRLRLIEINTNASMSLIADAIYRHLGVPEVFSGGDFSSAIVAAFREECAARTGAPTLRRLAIVDDRPLEQKLIAEFHMYAELFGRHGIRAEIADVSELKVNGGRLDLRGDAVDMVYDRDTDFYLQEPRSSALREALPLPVCLSPHPFEYRLLADKSRLVELSQPEVMASVAKWVGSANADIINRCLLRSLNIKSFADPDELWRQRKSWFFKPARSFGSKAAYRGMSISKKHFADILQGDFLAQEYVPAPEITFPGSTESFKYDLRFFVYRERIQLACARVYQGQLTNSQTPGGGMAALEFV